MLEVTMLKKYGPENLAVHYGEFDTICDATQVHITTFMCCILTEAATSATPPTSHAYALNILA
jgi:hypothetical protein